MPINKTYLRENVHLFTFFYTRYTEITKGKSRISGIGLNGGAKALAMDLWIGMSSHVPTQSMETRKPCERLLSFSKTFASAI